VGAAQDGLGRYRFQGGPVEGAKTFGHLRGYGPDAAYGLQQRLAPAQAGRAPRRRPCAVVATTSAVMFFSLPA
jgi:hypothetical protein